MVRARAIVWGCDHQPCGLRTGPGASAKVERQGALGPFDRCLEQAGLCHWAYCPCEWKLWYLHLTDLLWEMTEMGNHHAGVSYFSLLPSDYEHVRTY